MADNKFTAASTSSVVAGLAGDGTGDSPISAILTASTAAM